MSELFHNVNTFVVKFLSGLTSIHEAIDDDVLESINKSWSLRKEDLIKVLSKKIRVKKDKNHPKKNLSSYFLFQNDQRASMKKKHPEAAITELSKLISSEWKRIKQSSNKYDKQLIDKYTKLAAEDKTRYTQEMETYVPAKPDYTEKIKTRREISAYVIFMKEEKIRLESNSLKGKKLIAKIRENWKLVKEDENEVEKLKEKAKNYVDNKPEQPPKKQKRGRKKTIDDDDEEPIKPKKRDRKKTIDNDDKPIKPKKRTRKSSDNNNDDNIDENIDDIKQIISEMIDNGSKITAIKTRLKKNGITISVKKLKELIEEVQAQEQVQEHEEDNEIEEDM